MQFGSYCRLDSINILDYDIDDIASHSWVQIHLQMAVSVVLSHTFRPVLWLTRLPFDFYYIKVCRGVEETSSSSRFRLWQGISNVLSTTNCNEVDCVMEMMNKETAGHLVQ